MRHALHRRRSARAGLHAFAHHPRGPQRQRRLLLPASAGGEALLAGEAARLAVRTGGAAAAKVFVRRRRILRPACGAAQADRAALPRHAGFSMLPACVSGGRMGEVYHAIDLWRGWDLSIDDAPSFWGARSVRSISAAVGNHLTFHILDHTHMD